MRISDKDKTGGFNSPGGYMTLPVKNLNPQKKISWTMWNLDQNGEIESWLATRNNISASELVEELGAEWITISGDSPILDSVWHDDVIHGLRWNIGTKAGAISTSILYVPNMAGAFVDPKE